jgi:hypothetical protein
VQVLVDAIVNTGPREDSTRIGSQGTVRRQAVDVSPLRRVNQAIALLTIGVSLSSAIRAIWKTLKLMNPIFAPYTDPRIRFPQRQVHLGMSRRRARQRRQGFFQLVRHQEEGRARACSQEQPINASFTNISPYTSLLVGYFIGLGLGKERMEGTIRCAFVEDDGGLFVKRSLLYSRRKRGGGGLSLGPCLFGDDRLV